MKYIDLCDLIGGCIHCLYNTFGKDITFFGDPRCKYGYWEVVRIKANNSLLEITIEEPKEERKEKNEQENLLHKTETNGLAASVDQYNNTVHGQRKRDNNPACNASGNIPDDNKGKSDGLQRKINTREEKTITMVDKILEAVYKAYLDGEFEE